MAQYVREWAPSLDGKRLRSPGVPDALLTAPPPPPPAVSSTLNRARGRALWTPPGASGRDLLVVEQDMPTRANTGCTDYAVLVEVSADITYTVGGTAGAPVIVENKWFTGRVTIMCSWILFRNCYFNGSPTVTAPMVRFEGTVCVGIQIHDSVIWSQNVQYDNSALRGWHVEVKRCYIRGCADGLAAVGIGANGKNDAGGGTNYSGIPQDIVMWQNLVELMAYVSPDPTQALTDSASHLDSGIQFRGGSVLDFRGNRVLAYYDPSIADGGKLNITMPSGTHFTGEKYSTSFPVQLCATSAVMFSPIHGQLDHIRIMGNWMDGGACLINFGGHTSAGAYNSATGYGGIQVMRNRFGTHQRQGSNLWILAPAALPIQISNNVVWDVDVWDFTDPAHPVYLPDVPGTVTTTPANTRRT